MNSRTLLRTGLAIGALISVVGCNNEEPAGSRFQIVTQALTHGDITDATFRITVRSGAPAPDNIVWQKTITSRQYGDGAGALTYIGTCDASHPDHLVALELLSLSDTTGPLAANDFRNPAPDGDPIELPAVCVENEDTLVRFDLTIMRSARQGFFDIAVNFDDIFCSAKVDCGAEGRSLLLHDPSTGERAPTVVLGFACTAGDDTPSYLHLSELRLQCGEDAPIVLDPGRPNEGNQGPRPPSVFQWGIYRGAEFTQAAVPFDKCYTNIAIGLSTDYLDGKSCTLSGSGTASSAPWRDGLVPANTTYPIVTFDVPIAVADDRLVCTPSNHALDATNSKVTTGYVRPGEPSPYFGYTLDCATGAIENPGCDGAVPGSPEVVRVRPVEGGLRITHGAIESPLYALPPGFDGHEITGVAPRGCCVDPCCP